MATFDTIIKNGTIVDGTRVPRYRADVGLKNGTIAKIGRLASNDAAQVLDATGLIVAPGFIDLHTHYDAQIHWDPYCSISCWHGVTSVTIGNCGFGFAPLRQKDAERAMLAWMVRDAGLLSLEEAHFRLSGLPAWAARFKDRGVLREGMAADVVVYDLEKLRVRESEVAYDLPAGEWWRVQKADGYRWVMVNGQVTFEDGQCTGATPGKLLRHGQAV